MLRREISNPHMAYYTENLNYLLIVTYNRPNKPEHPFQCARAPSLLNLPSTSPNPYIHITTNVPTVDHKQVCPIRDHRNAQKRPCVRGFRIAHFVIRNRPTCSPAISLNIDYSVTPAALLSAIADLSSAPDYDQTGQPEYRSR